MAQGKLISFSDNYADNSTEAGFQFTFFCDICKEGYKTRFIESKSYKKGKLIKGIGGMFSAAARMAGQHNVGYGAERGMSVVNEKFKGMSPEWHKEHEKAFEEAQNETKGHFHRCPKCTKWVCENDWNEQTTFCTKCAPREAVEVGAARAEKMVQDIKEKASKTEVFTGEITKKQVLCPKCGKPAGSGKFCNNCGSPLTLTKCPKCGAEFPPGSGFCGECGTKME